MPKIIILYAIEAEKINLPPHPLYKYVYIETGIGKVPAALAAQAAIVSHRPSAIINIGSCGSMHQPLDSVHVCSHFWDRDMSKLKPFGLQDEIDMSLLNETHPLLMPLKANRQCNTGDSFLTSPEEGTADVFDMEAYAIAYACQQHKTPMLAIKCVSDIIGQNSVRHWEDKLADVRKHLQAFVDATISA